VYGNSGGSNGGFKTTPVPSGGGGGAGGVGLNASSASASGAGGPGILIPLTGSYYGGGGGGSNYNINSGTAGTGGIGGGGDGSTTSTVNSGQPNTGGGGGGGSGSGTGSYIGGSGGSGVVVLSVPTSDFNSSNFLVNGTYSTVVSGNNTLIKFERGINSFTIGSALSTFSPTSNTSQLIVYLTFDVKLGYSYPNYIPYTSGTAYVKNLAPLFSGYYPYSYFVLNSLTNLTTTNLKWGTNSLYTTGGNPCRSYGNFIIPTTGVTFCIWANLSPNSNTHYPLFGITSTINGNHPSQVSLRLSGSTAPWSLLNYQVSGNSSLSSGTNIPTPQINANTWYHYAWTISRAVNGNSTACTHTFYLNGSKITSVSGLYPPFGNMTAFNIGAQIDFGPNNGYFDTFRYYNRTLSELEIGYIYNVFDPANTM
jgi:hypothetical protein